MKAEGTTSDSAHSVVDPFDGSVGQSEVDVGEHAVAVLADRASHANEWPIVMLRRGE